MPAETKKSPSSAAPPSTISESQTTPTKKSGSSGKTAIAKVTLLDGSVLEVTIDVSSELNELIIGPIELINSFSQF